MAGSRAKKRGVSPLPSEDDASASSEDTVPPPSQETGSSPEPPQSTMRYRPMFKVRRSISSPFSGPSPCAEVCPVSPSNAVDVSPFSSTPEESVVPDSAHSFVSGERSISMLDVSASRRDVRNLDLTQYLGKLRNDLDVPEEIGNRNSDEGVEGSISKDRTEGFVGIEGMDANQSAMHEEEDRVAAVRSAARSVKDSPDDESVRKHQRDVEGEQITSDRKDQRTDNQPAQNCTSVTKGSEDISLDKTAVTSSSFSFGTTPLSFGTPTGFEDFRSTSSQWSSRSIFSLKAAVEGKVSSPSTAFQNSNATTFQSYSSQLSSLGSVAAVSPPVQTTAESLQSQEVPVETGDKPGKVVFVADATLFEYAVGAWTRIGEGELKLVVSEDIGGDSRLMMKSKGNNGLLLNALLFPDMQVISMDNQKLTFVCVNSTAEKTNILTTYAVKLKDSVTVTGFIEAVDTYKGNSHLELKSPKNCSRALYESGRSTELSDP